METVIKVPQFEKISVTVPNGKKSGDLMVVPVNNLEVSVLIPGVSLGPGDTFFVGDPSKTVTVQERIAPIRNTHCCCNFCGPYDELNCLRGYQSHLSRWTCFASSSYCCLGMLLVFLFAALITSNTILQIIESGGEWPTVSVQVCDFATLADNQMQY